ncbi:MAG: 4-(cytidine 5'-diphospho)-2-C-methyl-D-erythritol kinase [Spirochaetaceae bacterium]|nr:4-(cytidine 5'-diphospho)-2-C-methyl-D-erythritol kinase [Spirochaetaceae bacterium]
MVRSVFIPAYAKINISLRVGEKRNDGFHSIESIFQEISLADYLSVSLSEKPGCTVFCLQGSIPECNTLTKAYTCFCTASGFQGGVEVKLIKRIPACAGLGGASSDAVALLKALDQLVGTRFSRSEFLTLASQVGSDCSFFVEGGAAYVSGRGDVVDHIESRSLQGLLVFPHCESATARAYELLDNYREQTGFLSKNARLSRRRVLDFFCTEPVDVWAEKTDCFCNDFEPVMLGLHPEIQKAKQALQSVGASFSLMTGSGSSVYGLFESAKATQEAFEVLRTQFSFCELFLTR